MYAGIDSTLHLTETCENPRKVVPRALMTTVVVGVVTGFGFSIAMCYGITDLSALVNTRYVDLHVVHNSFLPDTVQQYAHL
jgi:choline transport protein